MSPPPEIPPSKSVDPSASNSGLARTLIAALLLPSLVTWVYFTLLHGSPPILQQTAYAAGKSLQFLLPAWVAWRGWGGGFERLQPTFRGIILGIVFGSAVCGVMFAALELLIKGHPIEQKLLAAAQGKLASQGLNHPAAFLAVGLFYSALHSLLEEYYWRWFVFEKGASIWGRSAANLISSLGFMAHHILLLGYFLGFAEWRTYLFAGAIALGGAFWAWLYQRTQNLTASWLSHAIVDAGIFGLGYSLLFQ